MDHVQVPKDPKFENQLIELEEDEEYENIEHLKMPEEIDEVETTKQLSPPEVNIVFDSEYEIYGYYRQYGL